jgi:hypothetical protein
MWYNECTMRDAMVNGELVVASPESPDVALCPACGGEVRKRKRKTLGGRATYFYRHKTGVARGCPRRYHPDGN